MHNDEGKLFEAVFHKLLTLGIVVVSVAVVVWIVWAIVRMSAITDEATGPASPRGAETLLDPAPAGAPLLANVRSVRQARTEPGEPDRIIELLLVPVARGLAALDEHLDRLPGLLGDAGFFCAGPS
jgi:hypothetical protein